MRRTQLKRSDYRVLGKPADDAPEDSDSEELRMQQEAEVRDDHVGCEHVITEGLGGGGRYG